MSGLADAASVTETDATGATGVTAVDDTAILSTKEIEIVDLVVLSDTYAATGLAVKRATLRLPRQARPRR